MMTTQNTNKAMDIWEQVSKTDPRYTKAFNRGGGFKGTATNPTYLVMQATKTFGPCGIGWGYQVIDESYREGGKLDGHEDKAVVHVIRLKLWYMLGEQRGEVEHFGQTDFVGKNKYGVFTDEEAPKKSLTDALVKCLSMLGFSADIHLGKWDDNKYVNDRKREVAEEESFADDNSFKAKLANVLRSSGFDNTNMKLAVGDLCEKHGVDNATDLDLAGRKSAIAEAMKMMPPQTKNEAA